MSDTNGGAGSPGLTRVITAFFTLGGTPTTIFVPATTFTRVTVFDGVTKTTVQNEGARTSVFAVGETISTEVFTVTLGPSNSASSTQSALAATQSAQSTQSGTAPAQAPIGAIVGAVLGALFLISLVAAGFLIRFRRAQRRNNGPHMLGPRTEAAIIDFVEDDVKTRPDPLILYENEKARPFSEAPSSRSSNIDSEGNGTKLTLASMADEMRALRNQLHRLQLEREMTAGPLPPTDELPPKYAPG